MILLASADDKIRNHWHSSLTESNEIETVSSLRMLHEKLRLYPQATVILHASLTGIKSLADIKTIVRAFPNVNLFVLADLPNEQEGIELVRAGVLGYANTHIRAEILKEAVKVVSLGEIWVSKRLLQWMVNHCGTPQPHEQTLASYMSLESLTPGEKKVVAHLLAGNSNKQIARELQITERTVKAHLTSIYRKTGVQDRLHLALLVNQGAQ